jgi:2-amino-4-hydroxy-6-hydroxymethyldihydropteridine diphosphokinase
MPDTVYLSLGSNLGDRESHLRDAIDRLASVGRVQSVSSLYETQPVDFTDQPWFLNCGVALETSASPTRLMQQLLEIEKAMGRQRVQKKGPRTIDIDILLFGDLVMNTLDLTIPHPAMQYRRFVLEPLAEIAPSAMHPLLKKTIEELLQELPPNQIVKKLESRLAADHTDTHGSKVKT